MLLLIFPICVLSLNAQVKFQDIEWELALKNSKQEGKPIFLYGTTSWCEPCQAMDLYTFSDLEVANYFNDRFINIKLDLEEYPGIEIAEAYDILIGRGMLCVNEDAGVLHRGCGSMDSSEFLELGKAVFRSDNLRSYDERFKDGEKSFEFIAEYIDLKNEMCLNAAGFAQNLMDQIPDNELSNASSFQLIVRYQWDIFSREFQFLLKNQSVIESVVGKARVNEKIYEAFLAQYQEVFESEELHLFALRALMKELKNARFDGSDTLMVMMSIHHNEITENWEAFSTDAIAWVGMNGTNDAEELNDFAWKFYLYVNDTQKLQIAREWAKEVVDREPSPSAIDTYASLHYKLGDTEKAIELENQALEMAASMSVDISHFEHQLRKFRKH